MSKNEMIMAVARKHGLEAEITVEFATLAEKNVMPKHLLEVVFNCAMSVNIEDEDE